MARIAKPTAVQTKEVWADPIQAHNVLRNRLRPTEFLSPQAR